MNYWIAFKNGEYVSGTDEFGYPLHTKNENEAYKFYDFNMAMSSYFDLGYALIKKQKGKIEYVLQRQIQRNSKRSAF